MGGIPQSREAWMASSIIVAHRRRRISAWKGVSLGKLEGSRCRPMDMAVRMREPTEIQRRSPPMECIWRARISRLWISTLARLRRDFSKGSLR